MQKYTMLLLFVSVFAACKNRSAEQAAITSAAAGTEAMPTGFDAFYAQFHRDSLFQLDHIHWPLAGTKAVVVDSSGLVQSPIEWNRNSWHLQHAVDFSKGEFIRSTQNVGDVMVIEKIRTAVGNYGLERRFARQSDGSWQLIYYADMHELGK